MSDGSPPRAFRLLGRSWFSFAFLFALLLAGSCTGDAPIEPTLTEAAAKKETNPVAAGAPGTVVLTPGEASLRVGEAVTLAGEVRNAAGQVVPNQPIDFTTSDASIASVDDAGLVTATGAGEAVITGSRNNRSGIATILVRRWGTTLTATSAPADPRVGEAVTVSGLLLREDGAPLAGKTVSLMFGEGTYTTGETDADGAVAFELGGLAAGTYSSALLFEGDVANDVSSGDGEVTVRKWVTTVTLRLSPAQILVGEETTLEAVLTREGGDPVSGALLALSAGGQPPVTLETNNTGGLAAFPVEDLPAGMYTLTVTYDGDAMHLPTDGEESVTVGKWETQLTVGSSTPSIRVGEEASVEVTLTRSANGNPVEGADVTLKVDGEDRETLVTDAQGAAMFTVNGMAAGAHTIAVEFSGGVADELSHGSTAVSVSKWETSLAVDPPELGLKVGEAGSVGLTLTRSEDGLAVGHASIALTVDGTDAGDLTTDAQGAAAYTVSGLATGSHTLGFAFAGDAEELAASGAATVEVSRLGTTIMASEVEATLDGDATLEATLVDEYGTPVEAESVTFALDGIPVPGGGTTDVDGHATTTVSGLLGGDLPYVASFAGSGTYEPSSGDGSVHAGAWPTTLVAEDVAAEADGHALLRATLQRADGAAVPANLVVKFYNGDTYLGYGKTDAAGIAQLDAPEFWGTGDIPYQARFEGIADQYDASVGDAVVSGVLRPSAITVASNLHVDTDEFTVAGHLVPAPAAPMPVHLSVGAITYSGLTRLGDGLFVIPNVTVTGDTEATLTSDGDDTFAPATLTVGIDQVPWTPILTVWPADGTTPTLRAQVKSYDGSLVFLRQDIDFEVEGVPVGSANTWTNGYATLNVPVSGGTYTYTASWAGNGSYEATVASSTLDAGKWRTKVLAENVSADDSGAAEVSACLTRIVDFPVGELPVDGVTLTFTIGSGKGALTATGTTGADGCALATMHVTAGLVTYVASYGGSSELNPISATGTVDAGRIATVLSVADGTVEYGGAHTFTATLTTPSGAPVAGKTVIMAAGDLGLGRPTTNGSGVATVTLAHVRLPLGDQTISASFGGDTSYEPSSGTGTLTVVESPTTTEITTTGDPWVSEFMTFAIVVSDAGGPLTTVKDLDISVDGGDPVHVTGATGSPYLFTHRFTTVGAHTVEVQYPGDPNHLPSDASTSVEITLRPTVLTISGPSEALLGQTVNLVGTLTSDGFAVRTKSVSFYLDGATVPVAPPTVTDNYGRVSVSLDGLDLGDHSVRAVFDGDGLFAPAEAEHGVAVVKIPMAMTLDVQFSGVRGEEATLTATLSAAGTPVPGKLVSFAVGVTSMGEATTDGSGIASVTAPVDLPSDFYAATADFGEDDDYQGASATAPLIVDGAPTQLTSIPQLLPVNPFAAGGAVVRLESDGVPLAGETIEFAISSKKFTAVTDARGEATLPATELREGTYQGTATFHATPGYATSSVSFYVTTVTSGSRLESVTSVETGGVITAHATLVDTDGKPLAGRQLRFDFLEFKGSPIGTAVMGETDANGVAQAQATRLFTYASRVQVTWGGDLGYTAPAPVTAVTSH